MYHMSGHMCKIWEIKIYFILNLAWHVTQPVLLLLGYQENTHCSSSSSIIGPLILHKRTLIVAVVYFIASSDCVWPTVSWQSGHRRMQTQPSWKNMQIKGDSAQEADTNWPVEGRRRRRSWSLTEQLLHFCWLHVVEIRTVQRRTHNAIAEKNNTRPHFQSPSAQHN